MINKERITHFSRFISVKCKKILGNSQPQFREKLIKVRLRQNDGFIKKKMRTDSHIAV